MSTKKKKKRAGGKGTGAKSKKGKTAKTKTKKKGDVGALICKNISFAKKGKSAKERKAIVLALVFQTASGSWEQKKTFDEVWKFVESHSKALNLDKMNLPKMHSDYIQKGKEDGVMKVITAVFAAIGKNKKSVNDSKVLSFVSAKNAHRTDLKEFKKISNKVSTASSATSENKENDKEPKKTTFISDLGGGGGTSNKRVTEEHRYRNEVIELQQEMENAKRKHLAEISDLKQENFNFKQQAAVLQETLHANAANQAELEEKVKELEHELGRNRVGDDMANLFPDEFKKVEDPAEKYFQQTKEQKKRIEELEMTVQQLSHENGDLKNQLNRAKYVADHLATEVTELHNPDNEQLEADYKEVEAELDEMTERLEQYESKMVQSAKMLDELEMKCAGMQPMAEEYPKLVEQVAELRKDSENLRNQLKKISDERDEMEDKYLEIRKKDVIPLQQHKDSVKKMKEQMQEISAAKTKIEEEKQKIVAENEKTKNEMAEMKMKLGHLQKDNERLEAGGGRDVNLEIKLDLPNDLSIFKKDEFEFPQNLSRDQLVLWCQHFKLLIKEINDELCAEINDLSERNETLESYIEMKGLPFPEDDTEFNTNKGAKDINDLPHPLPSMSFIDDLEDLNPSKQQLKDYIDLMFNEWRSDEFDTNNMIRNNQEDMDLLRELEMLANPNNNEEKQERKYERNDGDKNESKNQGEDVSKLKTKLDELYLKQEENQLKYEKEIKERDESIKQLQTQVKQEQQKNRKQLVDDDRTGNLAAAAGIMDDDLKSDGEISASSALGDDATDDADAVASQLNDANEYVKELLDAMKQLEFETQQQKHAMEREFAYDMQSVNIDLEEAKARIDDLLKQIGSDDLNLLASEFRNELWDSRNDNNVLKKRHIEEIRQLERDRDELLREINLLRIRTDRMDQNTDEAVAKMNIELEKKEKELEHFMAVSSNLSQFRDQAEALRADREQLEESYKRLEEEREIESNRFQAEINELSVSNEKLNNKLETARSDVESMKQSVATGLPPSLPVTRTELEVMNEEMLDLRKRVADAYNSKINLLKTSSLEIERLRDEIRLLTGDRKPSLRDYEPNRFNNKYKNYNNYRNVSRSSLGSNVPSILAPHQQIVNEEGDENTEGYISSAWTYTMSMLSSLFVGGEGADNNEQAFSDNSEYDIRSETNSVQSSIMEEYRYPNRNSRKPQRFASMGGYPMDRGMRPARHERYPSAQAKKAKRNRGQHYQTMSRNRMRTMSGVAGNDRRSYSQMGGMGGMAREKHRAKQPSKQEILIQNTDNAQIKDAMEKIFQSFDNAQDQMIERDDEIHHRRQHSSQRSMRSQRHSSTRSRSRLLSGRIQDRIHPRSGGHSHGHSGSLSRGHGQRQSMQSIRGRSTMTSSAVSENNDDIGMIQDDDAESFGNAPVNNHSDDFWSSNINDIADDDHDDVDQFYDDDDAFDIGFGGNAAIQSL